MDLFSSTRFAVLKQFFIHFLSVALVLRLILLGLSFDHIDGSIWALFKVFLVGFGFDVSTLLYLCALYMLYLVLMPSRFSGKRFDRLIHYISFSLMSLVCAFSFLAELPFWNEYQRRFNFIAVDYLLYTYEVVENIQESFSLPLILLILVLITVLSVRLAKPAFRKSFSSQGSVQQKLKAGLAYAVALVLMHTFVKNRQAEQFDTLSENELAKSGMFSFFAALQSNSLDYNAFYNTQNPDENHQNLKSIFNKSSVDRLRFNETHPLKRHITSKGKTQTPNVIFICIESLNARFMTRFGSQNNWTPFLDKTAKESILFTNLYATGTRTVRGLEAISLSIPPSPGRSLVKRNQDEGLFTIGEVFKEKGYSNTFFYGGDGHFDNMTPFFNVSGFDVVDKKEEHRLAKDLPNPRYHIEDERVTFENAWGVCDEDLLNEVLLYADQQAESKKPFFNFVMTSSNHPPFSYPKHKLDESLQGSREGAVRYTDLAIEQFITKAKTKAWFANTVFVFMADHCAYSAGRTDLNVRNHHIPAFIYNLNTTEATEIDKLASQIDLFPTLFSYFNWAYDSRFFGLDVNAMSKTDERAFVANHRKLGLLKNDKLTVLDSPKETKCYHWNKENHKLKPTTVDIELKKEAVMYYQTASESYKNGVLKLD
ncbi:MAG: LTA synthase family protein [Flavobacteriales bacterium]